MDFNKEAANYLIQNRRSIYTNMFSGEKIDDSIINQMLENANWAPTHKHTEPWRFIVFAGAGLQKLADFQSAYYREKATAAGNFNEAKYEKLKKKPLECSHIIAIGMHRDEKESIPEAEEVCAVACAVQNLWLTASAYGVGGYWSTGSVTFDKGANKFFGLGEKDLLLGFFYAGIPGTKSPEGKRKPVEEKVTWVKN